MMSFVILFQRILRLHFKSILNSYHPETLNHTTLSNIFRILERESKSTTYKFALLRGVIDIIQENSPYIEIIGSEVRIPLGLLVEKWLLYYYPIMESDDLIPQINGAGNKLAFTSEFVAVTRMYRDRGGLSAFYNDLKHLGFPEDARKPCNDLVKKIRDTIVKMPMKYIGSSVHGGHYSIFKPKVLPRQILSIVDITFLIETYGTFSIPIEYFNAFKEFGSFITGQDALLMKWAEFSVRASEKPLSIEKVFNNVLKTPITDRDILRSKKLYASILKKKGIVTCVWTGKSISSYDIDHVIPFSIMKNNDLWNLLPAQASVNNLKRDKIPTPELIHSRRESILEYWSVINDSQSRRFTKEIKVALLGRYETDTWQTKGIEQLMSTCDHLICARGFQGWGGKA